MKPIFSITKKMLSQVIQISRIIGNLEFQTERNLRLRKENRIKSIQSSLAIENNNLTIEQVTAIIDGKRVLGHPREIKEVKNAYDVYEKILSLKPYKQEDFLFAHKLLTIDILKTSGRYRLKDVGVFDSDGNVIHMGARPDFIAELMKNLFEWGVRDDTHELIKSCVFHYEIEVIHPFEDGNGRIGRLWQTVILANWNPIFAWIPIETIIYEHQKEYYDAIALANQENDSNIFIEFMLGIILKTLITYKTSEVLSDKTSDKSYLKLSTIENEVFSIIKSFLQKHEKITTTIACKLINKSPATTRRYLSKFMELELLIAHGENKNRTYQLTNK